MKPLGKAATLLPPAAFRADPLVAFTAFARYIPYLLQVHVPQQFIFISFTWWHAVCKRLWCLLAFHLSPGPKRTCLYIRYALA